MDPGSTVIYTMGDGENIDNQKNNVNAFIYIYIIYVNPTIQSHMIPLFKF